MKIRVGIQTYLEMKKSEISEKIKNGDFIFSSTENYYKGYYEALSHILEKINKLMNAQAYCLFHDRWEEWSESCFTKDPKKGDKK